MPSSASAGPQHPSMKLREYPLCQRLADARHAGEIVHTRRLHALQSAEVRQQRLAPLAPDAADILQRRVRTALAATRSMPLDRKPMGLVANLLQEMQAG